MSRLFYENQKSDRLYQEPKTPKNYTGRLLIVVLLVTVGLLTLCSCNPKVTVTTTCMGDVVTYTEDLETGSNYSRKQQIIKLIEANKGCEKVDITVKGKKDYSRVSECSHARGEIYVSIFTQDQDTLFYGKLSEATKCGESFVFYQ